MHAQCGVRHAHPSGKWYGKHCIKHYYDDEGCCDHAVGNLIIQLGTVAFGSGHKSVDDAIEVNGTSAGWRDGQRKEPNVLAVMLLRVQAAASNRH